VRRALFVGCASAFAGDFALLFNRHRCKSAAFFSHSVHSNPPVRNRPARREMAGGRGGSNQALCQPDRKGRRTKTPANLLISQETVPVVV
jgi:hypothetical protein